MTINNATVTGGIYNVGSLTVEDGNIATNRGEPSHTIYHAGSSLVVNGGKFTGNGNEVINANSSTAVINGGTFQKVERATYLMAGSKMTIFGGTFLAYEDNPAGHPVRPDVIVKGGTFNYKHNNIASGYEINQNANGTWTVDREYTQVGTSGADAAENGAALAAAINASTGNSCLKLSEGVYKMPSAGGNKNITIVGTKDTVIDLTTHAYMEQSTVSFEGVTIKGRTGTNGASDEIAFYSPNVTYTNCTFDGPFHIGRDGATFINCTFTNLGGDYV